MSTANHAELAEIVYFPGMAENSDLSKAAQRLGVPLWGRLLIAALVVVAGSFGTGFVMGFIRLGKMESAIRVLASKAAQDTRDLVRDLLAEARKDTASGNIPRAEKALTIVPVLLTRVVNETIPASPAYFSSALRDLNYVQSGAKSSPQLVKDVHQSRVIFAEYRSKLRPPIVPDPKATQVLVPYPLPPGPATIKLDALYGTVFDLRKVPPGVSIISPGNPPFFTGLRTDDPSHPIFLMNGTQKLDGMDWINVVFSHMVIQYTGGYVVLQNVKFVDCTFELTDAPEGDTFANYVALDLPELTISG